MRASVSELALTSTIDATTLEQLVGLITDRVLERLAVGAVSPWMSLTTTAQYLDWPQKRLYNLVAANEIPHRKQGNRLLFHQGELDHWLDQHYQGPQELMP
jgi:excisionase family DNA binding protein